MQQIPAEVTTTIRAFSLFWMFTVIAILIAGQWWQPARDFRDKMLRQRKPSLVIALLHALGAGIGGVGFFQFSSVATFCQAMIGLALAYGIVGYEPLPITQAVIHEEKRTESIGNMLGAAATVVIAAFFVNGLLGSVLLRLFGETMSNPAGFGSFFPPNAWQSFLLLLAGAGIAEETTYRLVCMSLFWHLTRRSWLAILLSALLFGAYHLSPLDALYLQYWERPLTVFTMSTVMGVLMGYVYFRRGYESAVLGHTLGDWIPMLLSRAV